MATDVAKVDSTACSDVKELERRPQPGAKVAFFGIFGVQNLGNECTLQAVLHHARQRLNDAQFCAISSDPGDTLRRHGLAAFPMSYQNFSNPRPGRLAKLIRILFKRMPGELMDWAKAVRDLRDTNLVVMTGTGMVTDYSSSAFGYPYHLFRFAAAARLAGSKVRFVGVGVGPIYERLSRRFLRWAFKLADYRSFRDEFSRNRIATIYDSSKDYVFPDLAFSLPQSVFQVRQNGNRQKQQVGLGIMDHRDVHRLSSSEQETAYSAYLDAMCEFVEWLLKHEYHVRILQGDAKYDVAPRRDLKARLEQRGIRYEQAGIFDESSSSVDELVGQIAQVDIVVSPRFHSLLLGIMMNIPAISISYDPKNDALLEGVGLGKYRQALSDLDVRLLIQQFIDLQNNIQEVKPLLRDKVNEYRRLLDKQYDLIFGDL
jgi:polysaccharide pyruvyl transferase WcaK-like protein